jgi:hypothetical protein
VSRGSIDARLMGELRLLREGFIVQSVYIEIKDADIIMMMNFWI